MLPASRGLCAVIEYADRASNSDRQPGPHDTKSCRQGLCSRPTADGWPLAHGAPPRVVPLIFTDLRKVYQGPVVQTQDLTVFNVTKQAVVARQAKVEPQPLVVPGEPRVGVKPGHPVEPDWFKDARIPIDDVLALP